MHDTSKLVRQFSKDEDGAIMIIMALVVFILFGMLGLAIDGGRAYHAASRVGAALDSAALAAAKAMNEDGLSGDDLAAYAERYFNANVTGTGLDPTDYVNFSVTPDPDTKEVVVSVDTVVTTYFGGLFSVPTWTFNKSSSAIYAIRDIELAVMLDTTGSMCNPCSKISALRSAGKDLVDILIEGKASAAQKVRIGLVPYSASVNAGVYADNAIDPMGPRDGDCVLERAEGDIYLDTPPSAGNFMASADMSAGGPVDIDPFQGSGTGFYHCPTAEIMPLTDDADALKDAIDRLDTDGYTAGQIGLAWAWYMVSDKWNSIWPSESQPAAYGDSNTIKAVLLMTDGIFNTAYANGDADVQAENLCDAIKGQNVIVFSVAFKAPPSAEEMLEGCRSPENGMISQTFFDAANETELREAFKSIAIQLNTLRLNG